MKRRKQCEVQSSQTLTTLESGVWHELIYKSCTNGCLFRRLLQSEQLKCNKGKKFCFPPTYGDRKGRKSNCSLLERKMHNDVILVDLYLFYFKNNTTYHELWSTHQHIHQHKFLISSIIYAVYPYNRSLILREWNLLYTVINIFILFIVQNRIV